jgi:hypothetical protein
MDLYKELEPEFVTGFTDGEGCFSATIRAPETLGDLCRFEVSFTIRQHARDRLILEQLKKFFNCGYCYPRHGSEHWFRQTHSYTVHAIPELRGIIIPHFEKHPLKTRKQEAFNHWKRLVLHIAQGNHLNRPGNDHSIQIVCAIQSANHSPARTENTDVARSQLPRSTDPCWPND